MDKTNSEQLFHHSNQPNSSPNSVWLRSHLIESESFLNPPRLGGFESIPNPIGLRSAWWTRYLVQIWSKSNPSPLCVNVPLVINNVTMSINLINMIGIYISIYYTAACMCLFYPHGTSYYQYKLYSLYLSWYK